MKEPYRGFTLIELITVMLILAASVIIIAPYATRRSHNQEASDTTQDIVNTLRYAMSYALTIQKPIRFVLECKDNAFHLEQSTDLHGGSFVNLLGTPGSTRYFSDHLYIADIDGFDLISKDIFFLLFDPSQPWPDASLTISSNQTTYKITMQGHNIEIIPLK